ncbi:hypothetical protein HDU76_012627 [Blyttiomyces sp. JEL0837]|nr:hypothetical protein HDU76_012627 [Blyttiomyces sp. JEL0837]
MGPVNVNQLNDETMIVNNPNALDNNMTNSDAVYRQRYQAAMASASAGFKELCSGLRGLANIAFGKMKEKGIGTTSKMSVRKITFSKVIWFFCAVTILALSITGTVLFTKSHPLFRTFSMPCSSGARDCLKEIEPPLWHKGLLIDDVSSPMVIKNPPYPIGDYILHYYDKKYDGQNELLKNVLRDVNETISVGNGVNGCSTCGGSLSYSMKGGDKLSISVSSNPIYGPEFWKDFQLEMIVHATSYGYRSINLTSYFNSNSSYEYIAGDALAKYVDQIYFSFRWRRTSYDTMNSIVVNVRGQTYFYPNQNSISACTIPLSPESKCQLSLESNSITAKTASRPGLLILSPVNPVPTPSERSLIRHLNPINIRIRYVPRVLPYLIVYTSLSLGMLSGLVILVMLIGFDCVPFDGGCCYGGSRLKKRLSGNRNDSRYTRLGEDMDGEDDEDLEDNVGEVRQHSNAERRSLLDV